MPGKPGPSEAVLLAAWEARRCAACGGDNVVAVLLADGAADICLCAGHFLARMTQPVLQQISQLRCQ